MGSKWFQSINSDSFSPRAGGDKWAGRGGPALPLNQGVQHGAPGCGELPGLVARIGFNPGRGSERVLESVVWPLFLHALRGAVDRVTRNPGVVVAVAPRPPAKFSDPCRDRFLVMPSGSGVTACGPCGGAWFRDTSRCAGWRAVRSGAARRFRVRILPGR